MSVFLASVSLQPGENWSDAIWSNLKSSSWVIFLASRNACQSPYVQQELGAALAGEKRIVPIVWDMDPRELPGWLNQKQAIDLRGKGWGELVPIVRQIAHGIRSDQLKGALIAGAVVFGLIWLASQK